MHQRHAASGAWLAHLCACGLGGLEHVRHGAGKVLGGTQEMLSVPPFVVHERSQKLDTLRHLRQVGGYCRDSAAHRCVVRLGWVT